MRRLLLILPICAVMLWSITPALRAQTDLRQLYEQIHAGNRIDATGQLPFHVKIEAHIYDLEGKPAQTGTVEEWWAAGKYRIEVDGPTGKEVQSSGGDAKPLSATRATFLLRQLLDQSVNPLNNLVASASFASVNRDFQGDTFRCLSVDWSGKERNPASDWVLCTPSGSTDLRVFFPGSIVVEVRNAIARFHDVSVARKTSRSYFGTLAVTGEVKQLEDFDAAASSFAEFHTPAAPEPAKTAGAATGVVAGHRINGSQPAYPPDARAAHVSGSVMLLAVIGKDGTMQTVEPLASASPMLTDAAAQAVKRWRYSPYLLNGSPTEIHTTIILNFEP